MRPGRLMLVLTAALAALACAPSRAHATARWWRPPADVRQMLARVHAGRLSNDVVTLAGFGTRNTLSSQTDPARGIGAATNWLDTQFNQIAATAGGRMRVDLQTYHQPPVPGSIMDPNGVDITNVVATLQGIDPSAADRVYVVGAHLDSRNSDRRDNINDAPGANDDGSGVAAMLELARVMAAHPTRATIKFAAFAGQEQGEFGSANFANLERAGNEHVEGVLNLDTIGNSLGGNGVRAAHEVRLFSEGFPAGATTPEQIGVLINGSENDSRSRQLARYVKETGENAATKMTVHLISRRDRVGHFGDQFPFLRQRFPAVSLTQPNDDFAHDHQDVRVVNGTQLGDLPQFLNFRYLARVTRVIGSALVALNRSPRAPRNAQLETTPPSYDAHVRWDPDPEPDIVGYEVVWRDTADPQWTNARAAGLVTSYTLKGINTDDVQIGVRAINAEGYKSPVAYAMIPTD